MAYQAPTVESVREKFTALRNELYAELHEEIRKTMSAEHARPNALTMTPGALS